MTVRRVMGTETEYAVTSLHARTPHHQARLDHERLDPAQLSFAVVNAASDPSTEHIAWDYGGEDPLNDARGTRLPRTTAPSDMLTDRPGRDVVNAVCANGARIYVDHAHPEYSSPECLDPFEALAYDRAGDVLMQRAISNNPQLGIALFKNNTDGKGASWGTHENYMVDRAVDFEQIIDLMTIHFVTRQIYTGSGRVGLGEQGERAGFQISQRADFIHTTVGLQTTFDRPIINTRDESHATATSRRFHVIVGDANRLDTPQVLKLGTTSLLLWLLESSRTTCSSGNDQPESMRSLRFRDPVAALHTVSHDLTLSVPLELCDGTRLTAWQLQTRLLTCVYTQAAVIYGTDSLGEPNWPDEPTRRTITLWKQALQDVATIAHSEDDARLALAEQGGRIEWLLKWQVLERLRRRANLTWSDALIQAADLRWAALDPTVSLCDRVRSLWEHLADGTALERATRHPPVTTRAWLRGELIGHHAHAVRAVNWSRITLDLPTDGTEYTLDMSDPLAFCQHWCHEACHGGNDHLDPRVCALLAERSDHG